MRLLWMFFKRDALIAMSYRTSFAVQIVGNFLVLGVCYYIGLLVGERNIPALDNYGGSYLAFLIIGVALTDCVGVSLKTFAEQIREGQLTGSLEATLMSAVPLTLMLSYSSLWGYFMSGIRFLLYVFLGTLFFQMDMRANVGVGLLIFLLTVLSFAGLGMLWAAVVMIIKRGEAVSTLGGYAIILLSGVFFPVEMLPQWMQYLTTLVPLTHALDAMRLALLQGYGIADLVGPLTALVAFAVGLVAGGAAAFNLAVDFVKRTGSLTRY